MNEAISKLASESGEGVRVNNGSSNCPTTELSDDEWTKEKLIDELQRNLAAVERPVTKPAKF